MHTMARCRAALLLLVLALLLAPRTGHGAVSLGTNHNTTLRPNLFFGTRTRSPEPVMVRPGAVSGFAVPRSPCT